MLSDYRRERETEVAEILSERVDGDHVSSVIDTASQVLGVFDQIHNPELDLPESVTNPPPVKTGSDLLSAVLDTPHLQATLVDEP